MNFRRSGILIALILLVVLYFLNNKAIVLTKQDEFQIHRISEDGYELKSILHFDNPNLLSSTVKSIREEYRINGTLVGILDMGLEQGIPGRKETEFPIGLRFTDKDLLRIMALDSTATEVQVKVTGEVVFSNFIGGGSVKVDETHPVLLEH